MLNFINYFVYVMSLSKPYRGLKLLRYCNLSCSWLKMFDPLHLRTLVVVFHMTH